MSAAPSTVTVGAVEAMVRRRRWRAVVVAAVGVVAVVAVVAVVDLIGIARR